MEMQAAKNKSVKPNIMKEESKIESFKYFNR